MREHIERIKVFYNLPSPLWWRCLSGKVIHYVLRTLQHNLRSPGSAWHCSQWIVAEVCTLNLTLFSKCVIGMASLLDSSCTALLLLHLIGVCFTNFATGELQHFSMFIIVIIYSQIWDRLRILYDVLKSFKTFWEQRTDLRCLHWMVYNGQRKEKRVARVKKFLLSQVEN